MLVLVLKGLLVSSVFQAIRSVMWQDLFPQVKLWEFFQVNVESTVEHFKSLLQNGV